MIESLCILGRQPALGRAELESLYNANNVQSISDEVAALSIPTQNVAYERLGGTIKLCRVLTTLETTAWHDIHTYLLKTTPEHSSYLPKGKMQLGLSSYGLDVNAKQLQSTALTLKKAIRATGRSIRIIPNQEPALNSAQVLHNHLTGPLGWELIFVKDGNKTILAQTVTVQDITAYTLRDRERPKRDAYIGMLPPKLAQIIVNLAASSLETNNPATILDPFCGTGVILQEALLAGFNVIGTDNNSKMVSYSQANITWLRSNYPGLRGGATIKLGDATNYQWPPSIDAIASETYLGKPMRNLPEQKYMQKLIDDIDELHRQFLSNLAPQLLDGTRLCIAIPAWKRHNGFIHLPFLDDLEYLGYNRVSFVHASNADLIYHRPDQIVARELLVMIRK